MLIEQNIEFEFRGPWCTLITGEFHEKTKIAKKNF